MLILFHLSLMMIAALCLLAGVGIAMFGRKKRTWLKMHKNLNTAGFGLLAAGGAGAQDKYQSIAEIRQSTPQRWRETYETKWRTVSVDVAVDVPDVAQFPVIRVTLRDAVEEPLLAGYRKVRENGRGSFRALMGTAEHTIQNNEAIRQNVSFYHGAVPDVQPENNPLSYPQALELVRAECARLFGGVELSVEQTGILGRVYRFKTVNGQREWLDPATETGYYFFVLDQGFRGIDYEASLECYDVLRLPHEDYMNKPYACFSLYGADAYSCYIALRQELDTVYADVPILPFAQAKAAIETEIRAGHLRSVDEVKLCYAPYYDPGDDSILWLLPVWYVKGAYTRNPGREFTPWLASDGSVIDSGAEYAEVVYQAQLGKLMEYGDSSRSRRKVPAILTWDDVR